MVVAVEVLEREALTPLAIAEQVQRYLDQDQAVDDAVATVLAEFERDGRLAEGRLTELGRRGWTHYIQYCWTFSVRHARQRLWHTAAEAGPPTPLTHSSVAPASALPAEPPDETLETDTWAPQDEPKEFMGHPIYIGGRWMTLGDLTRETALQGSRDRGKRAAALAHWELFLEKIGNALPKGKTASEHLSEQDMRKMFRASRAQP